MTRSIPVGTVSSWTTPSFSREENILCTEASYSFTAKGTCKDSSSTIDSVQGSVTRYKDVRVGERAPTSAVARQPVSAAIKADQSSLQSYRSGVYGNNRLGGKSLLDCLVFGRVTGVTCARHVLGDSTKTISLATFAWRKC